MRKGGVFGVFCTFFFKLFVIDAGVCASFNIEKIQVVNPCKNNKKHSETRTICKLHRSTRSFNRIRYLSLEKCLT